MSGQRRGPVGLGYMPKGGAKAAQRHNERVFGTAPAAPVTPPAEPVADAVGTGGRASGRPAHRRTPWLSDVLYGAAGGGLVLVVAEVLVR